MKKSVEDRAHLNKKLYLKSLFYLNLLNHKEKADKLNEYLIEKNIISIYPNNNNSQMSNDKTNNNDNTTNNNIDIYEKKNKNSNSNSNSNSNDSNESTNNITLNSTVTNFNIPPGFGYGYMNTINALNMCYYQKYFAENKNNNNSNMSTGFTGAESCCTYKKETSLKEIFENNRSYPFVFRNKEKQKDISSFSFAKSENKDISKEENKITVDNDSKANSY